MTPEDLEGAWPNGIPTQGTFRLNIPEARRADDPDLFAVVAENMRILGETVTRSVGFIDPGFKMVLTPSDVWTPKWDIGFEQPRPASDALALTLTAFYNMALDERGELFDHIAVDARPDVMLPHRRVLALPRFPPLVDEPQDEALDPGQLGSKQGSGFVIEFPANDSDDVAALEKAAFAVSDLMDVGCFDLPGEPPECCDMSEPFVGLMPETNTRTVGVRGFRGDGLAVLWLQAYVAHVLGRSLAGHRVVFFDDDR